MNSENQPLVTIAVPLYNHQDYIVECLESITKQTYSNIELIVIDDGSLDNSFKVAKSYLENQHFNSNYKITTRPNQGVCKTLNEIIKLAKGKYFTSYASDDIMPKDTIKKFVAFLESNLQFNLCGGGFKEINQQGKVTKTVRSYYRKLDFEDIFLGKKRGVHIGTLCYRLDFLKKLGGYEESFEIEDTPLLFKITSNGDKIPVLRDIFILYRKHDDNWSHQERFILEEMLKVYAQYKNYPNYEQAKIRLLQKKFRRASKSDKQFAREILRMIPWLKRINLKVVRGLLNLYMR